MDNETLQSNIDRLSREELAKIVLSIAANRDHTATALGTLEVPTHHHKNIETPRLTDEDQPRNTQHERNDSTSSIRTAPPPYSPPRPLSSQRRRLSLAYHLHYSRKFETVGVPDRPEPREITTPCVCKNCKRLFWSHQQGMAVADCVGHPGALQKLNKVVSGRRTRRLVEAKYLDAYSGLYKCWTCCLQKKSAPGCTRLDHHVAA